MLMANLDTNSTTKRLKELSELAKFVDYSLMDNLKCDPDARNDGKDFNPRQVYSGHYVTVRPTPIKDPEYVTHSKTFFSELGLTDNITQTDAFRRLFSGDISDMPSPIRQVGWATGYALSIYGTEYIQQCPFQTGNGYGDGRAVSVLEVLLDGNRWEMQLKGGGRTPYCRGADGKAVLRSSIREFLAQEHMHALGVPTTRSLCLYTSLSETVERPWYSDGTRSVDPDVMVANPVAITTRVAPSFLRVGQLELFGRRARSKAHPNAMGELKQIVLHLIEREYSHDIDETLPFTKQVILLAEEFRKRLCSLVSNWIRVGYCQGNFNSDNCAAGGFTLDYGPFGFCERFEPFFQPWTGGGQHFSFLNQSAAAEANFNSFCTALGPLLASSAKALSELTEVQTSFYSVMQKELETMWASKLGLDQYNGELLNHLLKLMVQTSVDYTIFFRELSGIPDDISALHKSFYTLPQGTLEEQWSLWLQQWRKIALHNKKPEELSKTMKTVNPKYTWREWLIVPAYQHAQDRDYALVHELQEVLTNPYEEQSSKTESIYYHLRPKKLFQTGGVSHYSCSS